MKLTKLEINNYKSIKSPITISFFEDLPTVIVGKNGSGKTNVLEALSAVSSANTNSYGYDGKDKPDYRAYIQVFEKDVTTFLPNIKYDKNQCEIVAYSGGADLKLCKIRSEYITHHIKKEVADIRDLVLQLKKAVDSYENQLKKISHIGDKEMPINCYNLKCEAGGLTNYVELRRQADLCVKDIHRVVDNILQKIEEDDEAVITFFCEERFYFGWDEPICFKLEYVEPPLSNFEKQFISINKTAIKREITKINKATKDACESIDRLIKEVIGRTNRLNDNLNDNMNVIRMISPDSEERYYSFLRKVRSIFGKRYSFLKNESNSVIFKKERRDYYYNDHSDSIIETYLRQVYNGSDREELLKSSKNELTLSEQAVADFEAFLNENIPSFDREMYDSITVQAGVKGHISIFLNEKTGEQINLNETSAGRRWYFTYYFMKNMLSEGDIFIIDEPAAMLHPSAQREVLCDLIKLSKQGVKVVYSTHSPYLIPDEWQCVHFVTMTEEGTQANSVLSNQDLLSKMKDIVGEDIFDVQAVVDMYVQGNPAKIGKNCYNAVISKTDNLEEVADALSLSVDTIKSWNRKKDHFRCPKLENVIFVSSFTNIKIKDLLS